jgi:hypothetical protein
MANVQVVDTVWKELQPLHVSVDFSMLEEEFAARSVGNASGSGFKALRPSRVSILQMQRSNNVAVFLSRLKMTTAEVWPTLIQLTITLFFLLGKGLLTKRGYMLKFYIGSSRVAF